MNGFTHQGPAMWLLSAREHVPGARGMCGSQVGAGLWAPWVCLRVPAPLLWEARNTLFLAWVSGPPRHAI